MHDNNIEQYVHSVIVEKKSLTRLSLPKKIVSEKIDGSKKKRDKTKGLILNLTLINAAHQILAKSSWPCYSHFL